MDRNVGQVACAANATKRMTQGEGLTAASQSETAFAAEELSRAVEGVVDLVERVEKRLEPVLQNLPQPTSESVRGEAATPDRRPLYSPVASEMRGQTIRLGRAAEVLERTLRDLAV